MKKNNKNKSDKKAEKTAKVPKSKAFVRLLMVIDALVMKQVVGSKSLG